MHDSQSTDAQKSGSTIKGDIHVTAPIHAGVVQIGHEGSIQASNVSQGASPALDPAALKTSLQELFGALGQANLPLDLQMDAQTSIGLAKQQAEASTPQIGEVAQHLQKVGQVLQQANVSIQEGSQLAMTVTRLAGILGPLVGGAKLVAGWFGLHLP